MASLHLGHISVHPTMFPRPVHRCPRANDVPQVGHARKISWCHDPQPPASDDRLPNIARRSLNRKWRGKRRPSGWGRTSSEPSTGRRRSMRSPPCTRPHFGRRSRCGRPMASADSELRFAWRDVFVDEPGGESKQACPSN